MTLDEGQNVITHGVHGVLRGPAQRLRSWPQNNRQSPTLAGSHHYDAELWVGIKRNMCKVGRNDTYFKLEESQRNFF